MGLGLMRLELSVLSQSSVITQCGVAWRRLNLVRWSLKCKDKEGSNEAGPRFDFPPRGQFRSHTFRTIGAAQLCLEILGIFHPPNSV